MGCSTTSPHKDGFGEALGERHGVEETYGSKKGDNMSELNGHGPRRAALYRRVSDEEREEGYSLADQRDTLREWAVSQGYEPVESFGGVDFEDDGWSGADLERPGLDAVRDCVASGGIGVVVVLKRDRLARGWRARHLQDQFAEVGTRLVALNVQADDSPEGRLQENILDSFSEFEREIITDRMRRGRLKKARNGEMLKFPFPHYGFKFNEAGNAYEVVPEQIRVVERIMRMVGREGCSLGEVQKRLEVEGVKTATEQSSRWDLRVVKDMIMADVYYARGVEELEKLVRKGQLTGDVLSRLDPEKRYGVHWFQRRRVKFYKERDAEGKPKKRMTYSMRNPEEWIAVPIVDSGIPPELIDEARAAVKDNRRPSRVHERAWELSGGIAFCATCGRRMAVHTNVYKKKSGEKSLYFYYRCPEGIRWNHACTNRKNLPAKGIEEQVQRMVSGVLSDTDRLISLLDGLIEDERGRLRGDPEAEEIRLRESLASVDVQRGRLHDEGMNLVMDGLLDRRKLRAKLDELDEREELLHTELKLAAGRGDKVRQLEDFREACRQRANAWQRLMDKHPDLSEHVVGGMMPWENDAFARGLGEDLSNVMPEARVNLYHRIGLRVEFDEEGGISATWMFGEELVCNPGATFIYSPCTRKALGSWADILGIYSAGFTSPSTRERSTW